jgi:hypothetical protein
MSIRFAGEFGRALRLGKVDSHRHPAWSMEAFQFQVIGALNQIPILEEVTQSTSSQTESTLRQPTEMNVHRH